MEIRPASAEPRLPPRRLPVSLPPRSGRPAGGEADRFERAGREAAEEPPFWVVAMATDRMTGRQYLSDRERAAAARLEAGWIRAIAEAAAPMVAAWHGGLSAPPGLGDWQALVNRLCHAAGQPVAPRVVWQPGMREDRGQFVFRVEGSLIQLRPGAPGTPWAWAGTVAHETYHHLQQEAVTALYRGTPALEGDAARLAAYFRDARNAYRALGEACPPEAHRRQALERGAWAFGGAIAQLVKDRQNLP